MTSHEEWAAIYMCAFRQAVAGGNELPSNANQVAASGYFAGEEAVRKAKGFANELSNHVVLSLDFLTPEEHAELGQRQRMRPMFDREGKLQ